MLRLHFLFLRMQLSKLGLLFLLPIALTNVVLSDLKLFYCRDCYCCSCSCFRYMCSLHGHFELLFCFLSQQRDGVRQRLNFSPNIYGSKRIYIIHIVFKYAKETL